MGLLTDIVNERHQKKLDEISNKTSAFKLAIEAGHKPDATPEQRKTADWAWNEMLGQTDMPKQAHPMVINLFKKILEPFGVGDKGDQQAQQAQQGITGTPDDAGGMATVNIPKPAPQRSITAPIEQQFSVQNQIAGNESQNKVTAARAMLPVEAERAQQVGGAQAELQPPVTKELGDGSIVQWDRNTKQWVPATSQGQPMTGPRKPPTLLNGKDGQPIGIQRPTGQIITTPEGMLPDERAVFEAAKGAFQQDLTRDEDKIRGQEDRFNKSQEGIANRFAQSLAAQNARSTNQLDYRSQTRIDDARRQFSTNPVVQRFAKAAEGLQFVQSLDPKSKNAADDMGLIYAFAKAMDPDSAVREGEYATIQRYAQDWLTSFGFNAMRVIKNGEILSEQARGNLKKTIEARVKAMDQPYRTARKDAAHRLNTLGVNGEDYIPDYAEGITGLGVPIKAQVPTNATPSTPAAPRGMVNVTINGKQGQIPAGNLEAAKKKYGKALEVTQ